MKRLWQIFVAPGEETKPLPIESSPWYDERRFVEVLEAQI